MSIDLDKDLLADRTLYTPVLYGAWQSIRVTPY